MWMRSYEPSFDRPASGFADLLMLHVVAVLEENEEERVLQWPSAAFGVSLRKSANIASWA